MAAVYEALRTHGYADLTMQDIADASGKSKSLLHYHYDTKAGLLVAFIDHLLAEFADKVAGTDDASPTERLVEFVDWFVIEPDDEERIAFHLALLELRAQAAFDEAFREQLRASDELLRETVAGIVRDGIEAGAFRGVDPEATAAFVVATVDGARTRQITLGFDWYTETARDELVRHLVGPLLAEGTELPETARSYADRSEAGETDEDAGETDEDAAKGTTPEESA